ncbi:MAG: hypothetical protein ACI4EK_06160, partial [Wujia sp.]
YHSVKPLFNYQYAFILVENIGRMTIELSMRLSYIRKRNLVKQQKTSYMKKMEALGCVTECVLV